MERRVLVTGGTRGIGKNIALSFKAAGYKVAVNYFDEESVGIQFEKETDIKAVRWDVSNFKECERGILEIEKILGGNVEILINNAGIVRDAMLHKQSYENWISVIQTNLVSVFNMSRVIIEKMREAKFGRIISMGSVSAHGMPGQTNYAAAKAGIEGFTKSLALETAKFGITANVIAPGFVDTQMLQTIPQEVMNKIMEKIPMHRLATTDEIAHTALFLAHDLSAFITGVIVPVNGGLRMY